MLRVPNHWISTLYPTHQGWWSSTLCFWPANNWSSRRTLRHNSWFLFLVLSIKLLYITIPIFKFMYACMYCAKRLRKLLKDASYLFRFLINRVRWLNNNAESLSFHFLDNFSICNYFRLFFSYFSYFFNWISFNN